MSTHEEAPRPGKAEGQKKARVGAGAGPTIAEDTDTAPFAHATVYPPCASRRRWAMTYRCPHCDGYHYGLSWQPIIFGPRRSGCGRLVCIVGALAGRTEVAR